MTVTFTNLSGTRENLDKTIRYLLSSNWTAANITGTITPIFESDTEEPDQFARWDNSSVNTVRVNLFSRERYQSDDFEVNGDDKHAWVCKLIINLQAQNLVTLTQMEDEVNRILWEKRPNGSTRLAKSGIGAADSEVAFFEQSELEFQRIEPDGEDDQIPTSEGQLDCIYFKTKT